MTPLDWSIDIVLLLLVVLQLRGRRLGVVQLLLPLALVGIAVWHYAQSLGMGFRLAFQIWAQTSGGGTDLQAFSVQHEIQESAWVDGLLLMAVGEVVGRTVLLFVRGRIVAARRAPVAAAA